MRATLRHVGYIRWATKAVRLANTDWWGRGHDDLLMSKGALHFHLFRWTVSTQRIHDPGVVRRHPYSYYVAEVYERDAEAVIAEARRYWRRLIGERRVD
jgi:hypothetical protein